MTGLLRDAALGKRFTTTIIGCMDLVEAARDYPCIKSVWIKFLGERPDPALDRVE